MVTYLVKRAVIVEDSEKWMFDDTDTARLILCGMGGAGKSQLALQCCKKAIASTQFAAVFWIDASSVLSVQESLKVIAATFEPQLAIFND